MTTRFADHLLEGTLAERDALTTKPTGMLFSCTDDSLIYQWDGAVWVTWATLGTAYTDEQVRDVIASALVAGTNVTITIDDVGNTITIAASGGGGGGGAVAYRDDLGGTDFTTTTFNSYVTVPGLTLSITPAVNSVFILSGRLGLFSGSTNNLSGNVLCSPAPTLGPPTLRVRDDNGQTNKGQVWPLTAVYNLAGGTTYTFTVKVYQSTSGTLTVYGDSQQTELSGMLVPA